MYKTFILSNLFNYPKLTYFPIYKFWKVYFWYKSYIFNNQISQKDRWKVHLSFVLWVSYSILQNTLIENHLLTTLCKNEWINIFTYIENYFYVTRVKRIQILKNRYLNKIKFYMLLLNFSMRRLYPNSEPIIVSSPWLSCNP